MRGLIRPALFWVARLGLLFSVMAWLIGQRWTVVERWPLDRNICVAFVDKGWVLSRWTWGAVVDWNFRIAELSPHDATWSVAVPDTNIKGVNSYRAVGVVWTRQTNGQSIAIRHWLIVTIFAVFYGVLKWVYRKRPEVADE